MPFPVVRMVMLSLGAPWGGCLSTTGWGFTSFLLWHHPDVFWRWEERSCKASRGHVSVGGSVERRLG